MNAQSAKKKEARHRIALSVLGSDGLLVCFEIALLVTELNINKTDNRGIKVKIN